MRSERNKLKFSEPYLLAMASDSDGNTGSQFFITLDECPWLDKKHTVFGRVDSQTIFNVLKIAEQETDINDRPIGENIAKILSCKVLEDPFGIEPRRS